jgi:hypothetical protein
MDVLRKRALLKIQQEYQMQFYSDEDESSLSALQEVEENQETQETQETRENQETRKHPEIVENSESPENPEIVENSESPENPEIVESIPESVPSIDISMSTKVRNLSIRVPSFGRKNVYAATSQSENSVSSSPNNGESEEILKTSAQDVPETLTDPQMNHMHPEERERLETPLIGMTISEESSKSENAIDLLSISINQAAFPLEDSKSQLNLEPTVTADDSALMEKRKMLMMNLNTILRPKEEIEPSAFDGHAASLKPNMPYMDNKQRTFSKLIPRRKQEDQTTDSVDLNK